ncbi:hypothetical protein ACFQ9X_01760 [Catenulispora yoronensis]
MPSIAEATIVSSSTQATAASYVQASPMVRSRAVITEPAKAR